MMQWGLRGSLSLACCWLAMSIAIPANAQDDLPPLPTLPASGANDDLPALPDLPMPGASDSDALPPLEPLTSPQDDDIEALFNDDVPPDEALDAIVDRSGAPTVPAEGDRPLPVDMESIPPTDAFSADDMPELVLPDPDNIITEEEMDRTLGLEDIDAGDAASPSTASRSQEEAPRPAPPPPPMPPVANEGAPPLPPMPGAAPAAPSPTLSAATPQNAQAASQAKEEKSAAPKAQRFKPVPPSTKTSVLSEKIYKKRYSKQNRHLPRAWHYDEYVELLFAAIHRSDLNAIRALINRPVDIEGRNRQGDTALIYAVRMGHYPVIELLTARGARLDAVNNNGYSPLHIAAFSGRADIIRLLLARRANPDLRDLDGRTPLMHAINEEHVDAVHQLLRGGADPDLQLDNGQSALHVAAAKDSAAIIRLLLLYNAMPDAQDMMERTPMHYAAYFGKQQQMAMLKEGGGLETVQDNAGMTPAMLSQFSGSTPVRHDLPDNIHQQRVLPNGGVVAPLAPVHTAPLPPAPMGGQQAMGGMPPGAMAMPSMAGANQQWQPEPLGDPGMELGTRPTAQPPVWNGGNNMAPPPQPLVPSPNAVGGPMGGAAFNAPPPQGMGQQGAPRVYNGQPVTPSGQSPQLMGGWQASSPQAVPQATTGVRQPSAGGMAPPPMQAWPDERGGWAVEPGTVSPASPRQPVQSNTMAAQPMDDATYERMMREINQDPYMNQMP